MNKIIKKSNINVILQKKIILDLKKSLKKLKNLHSSFDYIKISLTSPYRIKSWADRKLPNGKLIGEVLIPETINRITEQPEINGLFCEKIFGPLINWKCTCGKYSGYVANKICENCNVELTDSRVRRYRMGYIDLHNPVVHIWYLYGQPNYLCIFLRSFYNKLSITHLETFLYGNQDNKVKQISPFFVNNHQQKKIHSINEFTSFIKYLKLPNFSDHNKLYGAEKLKKVLDTLDLKSEVKNLRSCLNINTLNTIQNDEFFEQNLIKKIRLFESFISTKTNPSWMILTTLPVLPPHLRPLYELENGHIIATDINDLYKVVLHRNNQLFNIIDYDKRNTFFIFFKNYLVKLLQESVDSLIDNSRINIAKKTHTNNHLKSLTEILIGKEGRFRQTLLGKRVDYSGRSIIIVGPTLKLNQCGLPYIIIKELLYPFLVKEIKNQFSYLLKDINILLQKNKPYIWALLSKLILKHCVLLNRAPTLHRFGIQAFDPFLTLGNAITLHPLVCTGFNADFDGDQMAVHLPLYNVSQLEIRTMMRPSYNILSSADGTLLLKPSQDIVIGCYYLTLLITNLKSNIKKWFSNENEVILAYYQKKISLHTPVLVRYYISNLYFQIDNKILKFTTITLNEIKIYKKIKSLNTLNKYYFLTNIGIIIAYKLNSCKYLLTELFLETSPGRLIFSINLKKSIII